MIFLMVGLIIGVPLLVAFVGWMFIRQVLTDLRAGFFHRSVPSGMSQEEFTRRKLWLSIKFAGLVFLIVWATIELCHYKYVKSEKEIPQREMSQLHEASGTSSFQHTEGKRRIRVIRLFADDGKRLIDARTVLYDYAELTIKHSLQEIEGKKVKIWYAIGPRVADDDFDNIIYQLEVDGVLWLDLAHANHATDLWYDRAYIESNKWWTPLIIIAFILMGLTGVTVGYHSFRNGYEKIFVEGTTPKA